MKRTGRPTWTEVDDLAPELAEPARAAGYRTCWALPIRVDPDEGDVDAVIIIWRRVEGPPRVGHEAGLERVCRAGALAFERRQINLRLIEAATVDPLTGIPNRAQFFSALEAEVVVAPAERIAVLYLDLDEFKPVNDEHGHRFGDQVLATVATELAGQIRPGDMVARLGGDEFAVLCRDVDRIEQVTSIADRLIEVVRRPFVIDGIEVHVGLSIGIALAGPTATTHDAVLDAADRALYQAKRSGRGGWTLASTT